MRTCAPTPDRPRGIARRRVEAGFAARPEAGSAAGPEAGSAAGPEAGFTLVEMLVAMMLLSLVGLTLARFQTFQLSGAASLATTAAARLEADNLAVEALAAPALPVATDGISSNAGREWHYAIGTGPSPDPAALPDLMRVDIAVSLQPGGPVIARRTVLRSRAGQAFAQ